MLYLKRRIHVFNNDIGRVIAWSIFHLISTLKEQRTIVLYNHRSDNTFAYIEANYDNQGSCVCSIYGQLVTRGEDSTMLP